MANFSYRLDNVLEYRRLEESWAKEAYLDARADRIEAEAAVSAIEERRGKLVLEPVFSLDDHRGLEAMLIKLDDDQRSAHSAISVLVNEEDNALVEWTLRRQASEAIQKLRDHAVEEWKLNETRREQAELDEWAVMRRAA